jgi:hypothetical protein
MPRRYYFDEEHIRGWMQRSATAEGADAYFDEYVFGVVDFDAYLEKIGGPARLDYLREVEALRARA